MLSAKKMLIAGLSKKLRPQDVFATSLYTGNGGTRTITNGLDLAGKGGLVWAKSRSAASNHNLTDTVRGTNTTLRSNGTGAEFTGGQTVSAFGSNGFTLGNYVEGNGSGDTFAAWSFRRAKKFFDIVTYTGNGQSGRQIPHGLGDVPGMIVVKARGSATSSNSWLVYHRSLGSPKDDYLALQSTGATLTLANIWGTAGPTASYFTAGAHNDNGVQYVAYLFAHNPDLIDCGSYEGTGNTPGPDVTCGKGWTPQFVLAKRTTATSDWFMLDAQRGMGSGVDKQLRANTSQAENEFDDFVDLTATGFRPRYLMNSASSSFIHLAIRAPT